MSYDTDLLPFPIRIQAYETDSVEWFERISDIERHFELSEPITAQEVGEIVKIAREGVVYAAVDPYGEDVHGMNYLLLADSAESLNYSYEAACDDI